MKWDLKPIANIKQLFILNLSENKILGLYRKCKTTYSFCMLPSISYPLSVCLIVARLIMKCNKYTLQSSFNNVGTEICTGHLGLSCLNF